MRLLVTGGSGYLGAQLVEAARDWQVCTTYFSRPIRPARAEARQLDLRDAGALRTLVEEFRPEAIIHTACSNASAGQQAAIAPAARGLADLTHTLGIRLVHVSSDIVFDGEHAPYRDETPVQPVTDYGRAKAQAEAEVAALDPAAAIVRPSLIWGLDPLDRQTAWLVEGVRRGEAVRLFTDEIRCPVWVGDLCAALLELAARPEIAGPLNLGGPQALSRWEFGLKLLAALGFAPGDGVQPGTVAGSGLVRPRDLTLISEGGRARRLLRTRLRPVDEVLAREPSP